MKLDYTVIYSDRKTVNISVERDRSVVVRAPRHTTPEKIKRIIEAKKLWLFEKIRHKQKYNPNIEPKEFVSGESILYLGKSYRLDVVSSDQKGIRFNNKFIIAKSSQPIASQLFKEWYVQKAREKILPKVQAYAKSLGVTYNNVMISDLKYRWGSCTPKNNLNFNWRLIKAPMFVIEYVIVHELAHFLESNHTPRFWNIVFIQVPHYQKAKEWLKEHGDLLEQDL